MPNKVYLFWEGKALFNFMFFLVNVGFSEKKYATKHV